MQYEEDEYDRIKWEMITRSIHTQLQQHHPPSLNNPLHLVEGLTQVEGSIRKIGRTRSKVKLVARKNAPMPRIKDRETLSSIERKKQHVTRLSLLLIHLLL